MARKFASATHMAQIIDKDNPAYFRHNATERQLRGDDIAEEEEERVPKLRRGGDYTFTDDAGNTYTKRGSISAFSNAGALDRNRPAQTLPDFATDRLSPYRGPRTASQQALADYGSLIQKGRQQKRAQQANKDNALASMLYYAGQNGGFVPSEMMDSVSMNLGQQLVGGNFTKNGNFVLYGKMKAGNGTEQITPVAVVPLEMQFGALQRTGTALPMQKKIYGSLSQRYTAKQLAQAGLADPDQYYNKMLIEQDKADSVNRMALLSEIIKENRSQYNQFNYGDLYEKIANNKQFTELLTRGKMKTDPDGNPILDETTQQPIYEQISMPEAIGKLATELEKNRQQFIEAGRKNGTIKTREDIAKDVMGLYDFVMNGANANTKGIMAGRAQGAVDANGQPVASAEDEEAARLAKVREDWNAEPPLIHQPQEAIKYRLANGSLVAGNGYIRGDKVYAWNGREIPGATPVSTSNFYEDLNLQAKAKQAEAKSWNNPATTDQTAAGIAARRLAEAQGDGNGGEAQDGEAKPSEDTWLDDYARLKEMEKNGAKPEDIAALRKQLWERSKTAAAQSEAEEKAKYGELLTKAEKPQLRIGKTTLNPGDVFTDPQSGKRYRWGGRGRKDFTLVEGEEAWREAANAADPTGLANRFGGIIDKVHGESAKPAEDIVAGLSRAEEDEARKAVAEAREDDAALARAERLSAERDRKDAAFNAEVGKMVDDFLAEMDVGPDTLADLAEKMRADSPENRNAIRDALRRKRAERHEAEARKMADDLLAEMDEKEMKSKTDKISRTGKMPVGKMSEDPAFEEYIRTHWNSLSPKVRNAIIKATATRR